MWVIHEDARAHRLIGLPHCTDVDGWQAHFTRVESPIQLIAHAGGGTPWGAYSNSLTAMEWHYDNGTRIFEVDLSQTRDGQVVLLHDSVDVFHYWFEYGSLPPVARAAPLRFRSATLSHSDFMAATMRCGLEQTDLNGLVAWLGAKPDATIVTDVKGDNRAVLPIVAAAFGELREQVIVQAFDDADAVFAAQLGFKGVALTHYRLGHEVAGIADRLDSVAASIIVMHHVRIRDPELSGAVMTITQSGAELWAYPVNSLRSIRELEMLGVTSVMTDRLVK